MLTFKCLNLLLQALVFAVGAGCAVLIDARLGLAQLFVISCQLGQPLQYPGRSGPGRSDVPQVPGIV
ncbi:MAG: hypothetical protein ABW185_04440 [Sedimenticola sp.]